MFTYYQIDNFGVQCSAFKKGFEPCVARSRAVDVLGRRPV